MFLLLLSSPLVELAHSLLYVVVFDGGGLVLIFFLLINGDFAVDAVKSDDFGLFFCFLDLFIFFELCGREIVSNCFLVL